MTDDDAPKCARCSRPMRHDTALICGHCGTHLRALLARTAKLADDVQTTVARLDRITRTGSGPIDDLGWWRDEADPRRPATNLAVRVMTERSALEPVATPARLEASVAYDAAYSELTTWARHCCDTRGIYYVGDPGLETLCAFLAGQVDWIRFRDEADEACDAIEAACRRIERIVDRGPELVLVGYCGAEAEHPRSRYLYAVAGAEDVTCQDCGATYDVAACRDYLAEQLRDRLMTAAEIGTWVVAFGIAPNRRKIALTIAQWAQRGRIVAKGLIGGEPAYPFGQAFDMALVSYGRAVVAP